MDALHLLIFLVATENPKYVEYYGLSATSQKIKIYHASVQLFTGIGMSIIAFVNLGKGRLTILFAVISMSTNISWRLFMKSAIALALLATVSVHNICFAADPAKAFTPESVLPKGVDDTMSTNPYTGESGKVRKGTIAATLNNVALLNKLLMEEPTLENEATIQNIIDTNNALIPSLKAVGMFNLFSVNEWLASNDQLGRALTAVLYLQKYPKEVTPAIKSRLVQILKDNKSQVLSSTIASLLTR